jgi:hypothetical protein
MSRVGVLTFSDGRDFVHQGLLSPLTVAPASVADGCGDRAHLARDRQFVGPVGHR